MSKQGYTNQPCPGCGQKNERKKDSVCPECHSLMETGRLHIAEYKKLLSNKNMIEALIPTGWSQPNFYLYRSRVPQEKLNRIGAIMRDIADNISVQKSKKVGWNYMQWLENHLTFDDEGDGVVWNDGAGLPVLYGKKERESKKTVALPKKVFELLTELHELVSQALEETEQTGVEYGKNALLLLNSGKITMSEFNEK